MSNSQPNPEPRWYRLKLWAAAPSTLRSRSVGAAFYGFFFAVILYFLLNDPFSEGMPLILALVALMALVYLGGKSVCLAFNRKFQFRLRTLLLFVLIAHIGFSWFVVKLNQARKQERAIAELRKSRAWITYDWEQEAFKRAPRDELGYPLPYESKPPAPIWLRNWLGVDFFACVVRVSFNIKGVDADLIHLQDLPGLYRVSLGETQGTREGLQYLAEIETLRELALTDTPTCDADLTALHELKSLESISLTRTQVTDDGVRKLQHALPNCRIFR